MIALSKWKERWPIFCFVFFYLFAGKILLFYLIFYIALAAFFAGFLALFWQTLETERPKYALSESIIGTNPGLGFRPMPPEANLGSTLVWYKANRPENMRYWYNTVDKFLEGMPHSLPVLSHSNV